MSFKVQKSVWERSKSTGTDRLVLLAIADHAHNDDGTGAWPSEGTLARYANIKPRSVRRSLQRLKKLGELQTMPRTGQTNMYRVVLPTPAKPDRGEGGQAGPPPETRKTAKSKKQGGQAGPGGVAKPVRTPRSSLSTEPLTNHKKNHFFSEEKRGSSTADGKSSSLSLARPTTNTVKKKAMSLPSEPDRPTKTDVKRFAEKKKLSLDPEDFWLHYEARGWRFPDGAPIRSWRAMLQKWAKREPAIRAGRSALVGPRSRSERDYEQEQASLKARARREKEKLDAVR